MIGKITDLFRRTSSKKKRDGNDFIHVMAVDANDHFFGKTLAPYEVAPEVNFLKQFKKDDLVMVQLPESRAVKGKAVCSSGRIEGLYNFGYRQVAKIDCRWSPKIMFAELDFLKMDVSVAAKVIQAVKNIRLPHFFSYKRSDELDH